MKNTYISYRLRTNQNHCMSLYMDNILILENNDHMMKCTKKTLTTISYRLRTNQNQNINHCMSLYMDNILI